MVSNGKGGVLKTSLAANLAGLAALSGWRVLAVDLDPQGNLASDLGVLDRSDGGEGLLRAVADGVPLAPLTAVRPGLDLVAGGPRTSDLTGHLSRAALTGQFVHGWLDRALAPLAGAYNLVLFDCPPGEALIHTLALTAAHYVLIPTQPDLASIHGLGAVFARLLDVRSTTNANVEVLGVVVGPVGTQSTAIVRDTRAKLAEVLGESVAVFDPTIRLAQAAAVHCRERGLLAHEYEAAAGTAAPWWKRRDCKEPQPSFSSAAAGLAEDYQRLAEAILGAFSARQHELAATIGVA
ncbi:MAG: chromosome partitioning protein [Actinomycetota bacterium]|jgi:chromosome partitioning protein|nr:chromosome partitioning protein [Actinomycetota bacterium]